MLVAVPVALAQTASPAPVSQSGSGKTVIRAKAPAINSPLGAARLSVQGFFVDGATGISQEAMDRVLAPWKGRELSFAEYEEAVHAVARMLRANGHPNAEVRVSRAQVKDGMIAVAIQGLSPVGTVATAATPTAPAVADAPARMLVTGFRVGGTGSNAVPQDVVDARLAPFAGRKLTLAELDEATAAVATAYRERGYTLAQAFVPPQKIEDGVVAITVQPGIVDGRAGDDGLTVTGAGTVVRQSLVESYLRPAVTPGQPLQTPALERALRLAGETPGIASIQSTLKPGTAPGTTQVMADVTESNRFTGSVWADNHGSRYVGSNRLSGLLNLNSPSGLGEQYTLSGTAASGTTSVKLGAQAPIGRNGLRAGASIARLDLDIGQEIAPLNLNSKSTVASLFASYPLQRSATQNTTIDLNYDHKDLINNLAGLRDNQRRIQVATLSASGDLLDRWGGIVTWGGAFAAGNVDLSATPNYQAFDSATARTSGNFAKVNFNAARLTPLSFGNGLSLLLSTSGQLSTSNLDPVEKFQLGGPTGVRAYPVGEGLGDMGWLATAELRYNLKLPEAMAASAYTSQVFGFVDAGGLRQYNDVYSGALLAGRPNGYTLKGAGVGVSLTRSQVGNLRLVYAHKIGSNPNPTINNTDSDGLTKGGRVWIFGTISF